MRSFGKIVPRDVIFPFTLLTSLFYAWGMSNNMTDTMLAAFKRIMSFSDSKTAWVQVACYLFGYGMMAIPGAIFIKRYSYKSGVILGLGMYVTGSMMFYLPIMYASIDPDICYALYLVAIWVLFAGLSILETACNSFIFAMGPEATGTQRLNFAQSFNPLGSISGVVISQMFVLSNLSHLTATDRAGLSTEDLSAVQSQELHAVSNVYITVGLVMLIILFLIALTKMPAMYEGDKVIDLRGTFKRLFRKKKYIWGLISQFFYVGAQIAVWSYIIRYVMAALNLDEIITGLGPDPSDATVIEGLRHIDPLASGFYSFCEFTGLDALLPRTAEQAGATYYIISLILFVAMRFVCTALMKYFQPRTILSTLAILAIVFCFGAIYLDGLTGVYSLVGISACMSLMWPTIYGQAIQGLGNDTKMGGAGLVMTIAGGAILTQLMGVMSGMVDNQIQYAFWIPMIAFVVVAYYSIHIIRPVPKNNN